jgi:DtxR family transcriptional regulator, Mn-dependent transcriptional regulator
MTAAKTLTTTMEDYLEAIAWLVVDGGSARARDISAALSVHKSTVTAALRALAKKGLVNYVAYEAATLTPAGRKIADDVIRRHEIVRSFFMQVLALDRDVADANACRMEHVLDAEVLDRLAHFAKFVKECPSAEQRCLKQFQVNYHRRPLQVEPAPDVAAPSTAAKRKRKTAKRAGGPKRSSSAE